MPNEVIDRIHRMARQEHGNNGLLFEDRNHNQLVDPYDDGEDDSTYHPEEDDDDNDDDDNHDEDGGNDDNAQAIHNDPNDNHNEPADGAHDDDAGGQGGDIDNNDQEMGPDIKKEEANEGRGGIEPVETNSTSDEDEPKPMDHHETDESLDHGEPVALDDPSLPPRAQRELQRLANDGICPRIYQGRMLSQAQHAAQSMTTNGMLEASAPLPYQHMTPFEKELFHRRIAGVCPIRNWARAKRGSSSHRTHAIHTQERTAGFWAARCGSGL